MPEAILVIPVEVSPLFEMNFSWAFGPIPSDSHLEAKFRAVPRGIGEAIVVFGPSPNEWANAAHLQGRHDCSLDYEGANIDRLARI